MRREARAMMRKQAAALGMPGGRSAVLGLVLSAAMALTLASPLAAQFSATPVILDNSAIEVSLNPFSEKSLVADLRMSSFFDMIKPLKLTDYSVSPLTLYLRATDVKRNFRKFHVWNRSEKVSPHPRYYSFFPLDPDPPVTEEKVTF